ncbi:hypothetical protein R3I94_018523 [Phoxinus phoxinus]
MEKVFFFFCAFSCWILQITSSDLSGGSSDRRVSLGENIILNCSMRNRYEVAWYHFNTKKLDLLFSVKKDKTRRNLLTNYIQNGTRLKITADTEITKVSLVITGVREPDLGFYFCGTKSDAPEMFFDQIIRLEIEESKQEVEITDEVTVTERVLMFAGVGLAVFVFFLTTVIAGGIIYHRGQQKGWKAAKRASIRSHK